MAEEIRLVGNFDDNISEKLKRLDRSLTKIAKSFERFGARLKEANRHTGKAVGGLIKMTSTLNIQKTAIDANTAALKAYNTQLRNTARLERSVRGVRMSAPRAPRGSRSGRSPAASGFVGAGYRRPGSRRARGRGSVGVTRAADMGGWTSSRRPDRGVTGDVRANKPVPVRVVAGKGGGRGGRSSGGSGGSGGGRSSRGTGAISLFGPMVRAGIALDLIRMAGGGVIDAFRGIAQQGRQAELSMIQMTNAIQTIGEISDYGEAQNIAIRMREQLARIAVELPGGTNDFIAIQTRIMDDMILSLGSVEAVQKDLDKGTESFVGLFGTFARLAGLSPELAARDLDQLRRSPNSTRHVEILTRNANLLSAYMEEIAKTPGDFFSALKRAMERSMTDQTREALKNSFDVAIESFYDTLFNEVRGIFGTMRKAVLKVDGKIVQRINDQTGELEDVKLTMMESLGLAMRQIGDTFSALSEIVGLGPLESINSVIFEVGYFFWLMKTRLRSLSSSASNNMDGLMTVVNGSIETLFANLTEWLASLDYQQFFHYVDGAIAAMFRGIGIGLGNADTDGKNPVGTTVSGTALAIVVLLGAMKKLGFSFEALVTSMKGVPKSFAYLRQELAVFRQTPGAAIRGAGAAAARGGAKGVFATAIKGAKTVGKRLLILGGIIEMVSDLMEGKSVKEAFASGLGNIGGTALGAGIGTLIAPGIGTAIGAVIGGAIGGSDAVSAPLSATLSEVMGAFDGLLMSVWAIIAPFNDLGKLLPGVSGDFNILSAIISAILSPFSLLEIGLYGLAAMINWVVEQFTIGETKANARQRRLDAEAKMQNATDRLTITRRRDMGGNSLASQLKAEDEKLAAAIKKGNQAEINRIKAYRQVILDLMGNVQTGQNKPNTNSTTNPANNVQPGPNNTQNQTAPTAPYAPQGPGAATMMSNNGNPIFKVVEAVQQAYPKIDQLNTTFVTYLENLITLGETTNSELGTARSTLSDISGKLTSPMSVKVTNLSEIKISPPPATTTNTVAPAVTQTAGTTNGGVMLKVENTFNAAEMSEDVMAEKVSASIIRAIDDAGYREVYEA